ncbi:MAG: ELM1/GtrOC1 family putative glycosyltransferase [Rhizobiaceae bacterium]
MPPDEFNEQTAASAGLRPDRRRSATAPNVHNSIWILSNGRQGDLDQMRILADAIGWDTSIKRLVWRWPAALRLNPLTPLAVDWQASGLADKPFPTAIMFSEARTTHIALALKRRLETAGHASILICNGRPASLTGSFDIVVTSAQYQLPERPNVVHLPAPAIRRDRMPVPQTCASAAALMSSLAQPRLLALVGGASSPDILGPQEAEELLAQASEWARERQGSLVVATSPRTSPEVQTRLQKALPDNAVLYCWKPDDPHNPHPGYLQYADAVLVTSDSVSMMVEAALFDLPVDVFPLPKKHSLRHRLIRWLWRRQDKGLTKLARPLFKLGLLEPRANRGKLLTNLSEQGYLAGQASARHSPLAPALDEAIEQAASMIRQKAM